MSAGKIEITFEGLCAFFSKHLTETEHRLTVGLIGIWGATDITHIPTLTIEDEVSETTVYSGKHCRTGLTGDVYLHFLTEDGSVENDIAKNSTVSLLDVESLYEPGELGINPEKCQARLHFRNGTLSQIRSSRVEFKDPIGNPIDGHEDVEEFTYSVKLEIPIPESCYPILHFDSGANDFVFNADRNYIITVTSLPNPLHPGEHAQTPQNHFQYFYRIADNRPATLILPNPADGHEDGRPWCMLGEFGGTEG